MDPNDIWRPKAFFPFDIDQSSTIDASKLRWLNLGYEMGLEQGRIEGYNKSLMEMSLLFTSGTYEERKPFELAILEDFIFSSATNEHEQIGDAGPIEHAIEASRYILEYGDDWDGEGSVAYQEITWQRATNFLRDLARSIVRNSAVVVDAPSILPGPDGSIDIHWEYPDYELLLNIPVGEETHATFFGDNKSGDFVKGKINIQNPSSNNGLVLWLTSAR